MRKGRHRDPGPRAAGPRAADARPRAARWGSVALAAGLLALALSGAAEAGGVLRWGAAMNTIAQDAVYAGVGGMIIGAVMCGVAVATAAQAVLYQGMGLCAGGAIALGGSALITSLFGAGAGGGPVSLTDYARAAAVPAPALVASPRRRAADVAPAGPLEEEVPGWTIPEQPALLVTPKVLGLPMPVTGTLVTVCLVLAIGLHTYAESLVLFLVLWLGGRRLLAKDPFAWILLFLRPSVPRVLYPGGGGG